MPIDKIFTGTAQYNLPCHRDLRIFFEPNGRLLLVTIIEDDCNAGLGDTGLASLVD